MLAFLILFHQCTKDKGSDPELPYQDIALVDSARMAPYFYKGKDTVWAGAHGPHGPFKLRFNARAFQQLTDSGRLPKNKRFIDGSLVVKDVWKNGKLFMYAYMYKYRGAWLWGETDESGKIIYGKADGDRVCLGCHTQNGHRDNVVAFQYY